MRCRIEDAVILLALSMSESEDFGFGQSLTITNPRTGLNHFLAGKKFLYLHQIDIQNVYQTDNPFCHVYYPDQTDQTDQRLGLDWTGY